MPLLNAHGQLFALSHGHEGCTDTGDLGPCDCLCHRDSLVGDNPVVCGETAYATPVRRLHLERDEDVSGVSGVGVVAYGAVFPDGTLVLRWDTVVVSTVLYSSVEDLVTITGHGGRTRVVWDDDE